MTGIDTSEGIVNLYVTDPSAVTGYLKSIGKLLPEHVRIVQLKKLATPVAAIYGGLSLDSPINGTTIYQCTLSSGDLCAIYGPIDQIHEILGISFIHREYLPFSNKN